MQWELLVPAPLLLVTNWEIITQCSALETCGSSRSRVAHLRQVAQLICKLLGRVLGGRTSLNPDGSCGAFCCSEGWAAGRHLCRPARGHMAPCCLVSGRHSTLACAGMIVTKASLVYRSPFETNWHGDHTPHECTLWTQKEALA